MILALIDNGSLEPAAHQNLRAVAAALTGRCGKKIHAVSWKHSDRIPAAALAGTSAWTIRPFVRAMTALGQREFLFVPFFISGQGAVGSALRQDLEQLQSEVGGFEFSFADGLAAYGVIPRIAVDRIRQTIAQQMLTHPTVVVTDHGGPSAVSALLRDQLAEEISSGLMGEVGRVFSASMEGEHPPLLADLLNAPEFADRDVVVSLLFLSPGRHAGPHGDVAKIAQQSSARCHFTALIGTHHLAVDALQESVERSLTQLSLISHP